MLVDDLVKRRDSWLLGEQDPAGIVVSSRVRLARNVKGFAFPGWAQEEDRVRLCGELRRAFEGLESLPDPIFVEMHDLSPVDRDVLKERHLISKELAEKGPGSGLIVARDESAAAMINEEDHLRLQAVARGLDLHGAWRRVDRLDSELEERLEYAFSPRLGYLTACPTNVGTGLRASVMVHLSGLRFMGEVEAVMRGLDKLGLAVRGLSGEGTEAYGNICQISNQSTLGESEEEIIEGLLDVVQEVVGHERQARLRLLDTRESHVLDQIGRAFGVLRHARILPSREAIDLMAGLRLGVEFALVRGLSVADLNEIMLLTQPGHLQKILGRLLNPDERDEARADMVRRKLEHVELTA
jgi:protein arginine kinase